MDNRLSSIQKARDVALIAAERARQRRKTSIFTISNTAKRDNMSLFFPPIRETASVVAGSVMIFSVGEARMVAQAVDGIVRTILVDVEAKVADLSGVERAVRDAVTRSKVLTFKSNDLTADAVDALLAQLVGDMRGKRVAVIGAGNLGSKISLKLLERHANVVITRSNDDDVRAIVKALNIIKPRWTRGLMVGTTDNLEASNLADVLISCTPGTKSITPDMVAAMSNHGTVVDAGIGTLFPEAVRVARRRGMTLLRLDMRAGFAGAVVTILETKRMLADVMGQRRIAGVTVVAGGFIGRYGEVVVDSISKPRQVIGVADGTGNVILETDDAGLQAKMDAVRREQQKLCS